MENTATFLSTPRETRFGSLPATLAAVLALALYAITLGGTYVYDDTMLRPDPRPMHPDEDQRYTHRELWYQFWTRDYHPDAVDKLYRPLTSMTFAIEFWMHGDRPWVYHLVNWLLHAAVAAAVAELARRLMGFRVAIGAGVLFAVHPVHVEAVAGLVGRAELLCTLATIGALIVFLKPMTFRRVLAIAVCFVVAMLSKEQGILLPAILLALVPFRKQILRSSNIHSTSDNLKSEDRALMALIVTILLIAAFYLFAREKLLGFDWDRDALDWEANPLIRSTGLDRVLMPLVLLGRYLLLMTWPPHLSLDYGSHVIGWRVNWGQPYIYLGAATAAGALGAMAWAILRRRWAVFFCLAALAISYGMVSNSVILIGTIFAERLMYMPSVFFLIVVTALLARCLRPAMLAIVILALLGAAGSIRTFGYARLWNDPLELSLVDLSAYPKSMHLHGLVIDQYLSRGDYIAAQQIAKDCLTQVPDSFHACENCVAVDIKLHDFNHAKEVLDKARPYGHNLQLRIGEKRQELKVKRAEWEFDQYVSTGDYLVHQRLLGMDIGRPLACVCYLAARQLARDCLENAPNYFHSYEMAIAADIKLHDFNDADEILARTRGYERMMWFDIPRLRSEVEAARAKFVAETRSSH